MNDSDFLFIVAEVAVAFAGFASIVAVLGQRATRDHPRLDAFRLRGLLECSLAVAAFSLLPYAIARSTGDEPLAWRLCAATFLVVGLLLIWSTGARRRSIEDIPVTAGIRVAILILYLAPLPALAAVSLGLAGPGVYLLCLVSYLFAAGVGFFRVLASFLAAVTD